MFSNSFQGRHTRLALPERSCLVIKLSGLDGNVLSPVVTRRATQIIQHCKSTNDKGNQVGLHALLDMIRQQEDGPASLTLTFPFFQHSSRLRQGEALHCLISLASFRTGIHVFQNIVCFHQHTTVKCMAFLSLGLVIPRNSINF